MGTNCLVKKFDKWIKVIGDSKREKETKVEKEIKGKIRLGQKM